MFPADNVGLHIDGILYVKVEDAYKASYGVEDPEYAVTQLAQTTMRSEIGWLRLLTIRLIKIRKINVYGFMPVQLVLM